MSHSTIPPLADLLATARVVSLPLRTKFRGLNDREMLLFSGPNGWTEWSPFIEYEDEESATWLKAAIHFSHGQMPALNRNLIPVNATLPAVAPDQVAKVLGRFGTFNTVKIKVAEGGQKLSDDVDRIMAVRAAYPDAKLRLDANGKWTVDLALSFTKALFKQGIQLEYLEQPVATIGEMAELRVKLLTERIPVKIAADESVLSPADVVRVAGLRAADIITIKIAKSGGLRNASTLVECATHAGLSCNMGSKHPMGVGAAAILHFAAAVPAVGEFLGYGSALERFVGDVIQEEIHVASGCAHLPAGLGLGVSLDMDRLKHFSLQHYDSDRS